MIIRIFFLIIIMFFQLVLTNCDSTNAPVNPAEISNTKGIEELTIKDFEILIFPIPFRDNFRIAFVLQENSFVRLSLENVVGQEIMIIDDSMKLAGEHTFNVDGKSFDDGIYIVHLEIAGVGSIRKFIVKATK
ncbi:MAG: T9SS type A sorting domain-containing protein [bacterium]